MNAILKYPGSKWTLAERIVREMPSHKFYLEPFFGSGAVLFNKPRSNIETVNDLDGNVVNLFQWIKEDPERLAHEKNVRQGKRKKNPERPAKKAAERRAAPSRGADPRPAVRRGRPGPGARAKPYAHSHPVKKGKGSFRKRED